MHALRVRREEINIVAGRPRRTEGQNEFASVWQGFCVAQYGRQVHPDQTKAVKGQNRKTLAMAGAIKRPLPCPVEGIEKHSIFYKVKRKKTEQEEKKKDKNENREEKKGN